MPETQADTAPGTPLLTVRNLSVRVGPPGESPVVRGLDLQIAEGEMVCLAGASGAGKSVASRALMRLDAFEGGGISGGEIVLGHGRSAETLQDAGSARLRALRGREIAMIFQEPAASLNPVRSIGSQMAELLRQRAQGLSRPAARARAGTLLSRVGFERPGEILRRYPHQLSGGMCQRVMIALALAGEPRLLIADEPTTALDAVAQAEILALLDRLRRETGLAILLITHDRDVVARMADRVFVMEEGALVESGAADAVLARPESAAAKALGAARPAAFRAVPAVSEPVLELRDLCAGYGAQAVVRGVTLMVGAGETLALVGQSGSGKTTLARAALRLVDVRSGRVLLGGRDITGLQGEALRRVRARMQMIFQDPLLSLDPRRSLGVQVGDPLRNFGVPAAEREDRVAALFDRVGLPRELMARRPRAASGGQRQRAAIARALAPEPELIVADEALASLDAQVRQRISDLLVSLQEERGLACLFISHDIAGVARIAHRVAVMQAGRIVEEGPARAVLETPGHAYTRALIAASKGEVREVGLAPPRADDRMMDVGPGHRVLMTQGP